MYRTIAVALVLLGALPARADGPAASHRIVWDERWPHASPAEASFAVNALLGVLTIQYGADQPARPRWTGENAFDRAVRDGMVGRTLKARRRIALVSDVLLGVALAYPLVIDASLVPAIDRNADLARDLWVMDAEAYGVVGITARSTERIAARGRPATLGCATDRGWVDDCASHDMTASFFSGHSSLSAVAAGVTCAHHAYLRLYGGGVADAIACASMTSLAVSVAALRIAADKHWATDVLTGFGVGFGLGLGLPVALHYAQRVPGARLGSVREPEGAPATFSWGGAF